ncbi:hypothetical protein [Mucilaginibacter xinganensis]|uniref:DUF937 domain-containing protein n=1 Tax=Mucilaginibacter xinganensis TaxID=1234841 RepID=A0A223NXY6_9SPHI|nr:hypothetical protein [Mucilaginibacter xinganensis]ASU34431.1 hypothetical protein MuYL_2544 [Mucilaginibacter xinganensis]
MSLKTFLEKLLPFLFNAVERAYDQLPQSEKDALVKSGQFGQIIKTELTNGYNAIVKVSADKLGLKPAEVDLLLTSLAKEMSINISKPSDIIDALQSKVNAGLTNSGWDSLWTTISGQLAIIVTGGSVSWPTLALGLIEFVYQKFIQPKA